MWTLWHLLLVLTIALNKTILAEYNIFCYWGSWAFYRPGDGKFMSWNIESKYCTHLGYAFFGVNELGQLKDLDNFLSVKMGMVHQAAALKRLNPKLKVLLSVGGWKEGSVHFSNMAADRKKRYNFISTTLSFLEQNEFDGVDLVWQYPAQRGGKPWDRENFIQLLEELRDALDENNFQLTIAVGGNLENVAVSYDIPKIVKFVDLINLMTFDYHGPWDSVLGHNSPLNLVETTVKYWIEQTGNASKLLLGIPFYGHTYSLENQDWVGIGARTKGSGMPGRYSRQAGFMGYNEFCLQASRWKHKFDEDARVPYAHRNNQWISFDDSNSIGEKVIFLKEQKLGGAMIWAYEMDDFRGKCGETYPLMKAINLQIGYVPVPEAETTTDSGGMCRRDGVYSIPFECARFYECRGGEREDYECLNGLQFDPKLGHCNLAKLVKCKKDYVEWKPGMKKFNFRNFPINLKVPYY